MIALYTIWFLIFCDSVFARRGPYRPVKSVSITDEADGPRISLTFERGSGWHHVFYYTMLENDVLELFWYQEVDREYKPISVVRAEYTGEGSETAAGKIWKGTVTGTATGTATESDWTSAELAEKINEEIAKTESVFKIVVTDKDGKEGEFKSHTHKSYQHVKSVRIADLDDGTTRISLKFSSGERVDHVLRYTMGEEEVLRLEMIGAGGAKKKTLVKAVYSRSTETATGKKDYWTTTIAKKHWSSSMRTPIEGSRPPPLTWETITETSRDLTGRINAQIERMGKGAVAEIIVTGVDGKEREFKQHTDDAHVGGYIDFLENEMEILEDLVRIRKEREMRRKYRY